MSFYEARQARYFKKQAHQALYLMKHFKQVNTPSMRARKAREHAKHVKHAKHTSAQAHHLADSKL